MQPATKPKRGPGRPPGSKNKPKGFPPFVQVLAPEAPPPPAIVFAPSASASPETPTDTTRARLEADRDRLLRGIDECKGLKDPATGLQFTDWKTVAQLQSQLNGVNRMLLRITGESAPTNTDLLRSPQVKAFVSATLETCCSECLEKLRSKFETM